MRRPVRQSLIVLVSGTVVALLLLNGALLFMDAEQCPEGYTQQQIDASSCIIGANIGQGVVVLLAIAVWIVSALVALGVAILSRSR